MVAIISMFEEMPSGYHKIEGLDYLVRRINTCFGQIIHIILKLQQIIAWDGSGYIEFMETEPRRTFNTASID